MQICRQIYRYADDFKSRAKVISIMWKNQHGNFEVVNKSKEM